MLFQRKAAWKAAPAKHKFAIFALWKHSSEPDATIDEKLFTHHNRRRITGSRRGRNVPARAAYHSVPAAVCMVLDERIAAYARLADVAP